MLKVKPQIAALSIYRPPWSSLDRTAFLRFDLNENTLPPVLQPEISKQLLANKVEALNAGGPELIATANIGCQMHIATAVDVPVVHWLELLQGK